MDITCGTYFTNGHLIISLISSQGFGMHGGTIKDLFTVFAYVNNEPVTRSELVSFYKLLKPRSSMSTEVQWNRAITTCMCNYDRLFRNGENNGFSPHKKGENGCIRFDIHAVCRKNLAGCAEECAHKGKDVVCNRVSNSLHWIRNDIWQQNFSIPVNVVEPVPQEVTIYEDNVVNLEGMRRHVVVPKYYLYRFDRENILYMGNHIYFVTEFVNMDEIKTRKDLQYEHKRCKDIYHPEHKDSVVFAKMMNAFTVLNRILSKGSKRDEDERLERYKKIIEFFNSDTQNIDKSFRDRIACAEILELLQIGMQLRCSR